MFTSKVWQMVLIETKILNSLEDFKTILGSQNNTTVIRNFAKTFYQVYNPSKNISGLIYKIE